MTDIIQTSPVAVGERTREEPFPIIVYPEEVFGREDDRELLDRIMGEASATGMPEEQLIISSFQGKRIFRDGSFGGLWQIKGFSLAEVRADIDNDRGINNPIAGLERKGALPAVAILDGTKMREVGQRVLTLDEDYVTYTPEFVPRSVNRWETADGRSLDTTTKVVLLFKRAA